MQWEKVLPDGLGEPGNDRIYFSPFYMGGRVGNYHRYYRLLYISAWGPSSTRGGFYRVSAEVPETPVGLQDVYHEIEPLSWSWKGAAVELPTGTETNRPLEPQRIGPITHVYKGSFPFLGEDPRHKRDYYDLYVCAESPITVHDPSAGTYITDASVIYRGALTPFEFSQVNWSLEAVLLGRVTDPVIIGFKGCIFVTLGAAEIGTNATGIWSITGQEIRAYNSENEVVSSFYVSSDVLYAGTWALMRAHKGAEIWKTTDGKTWELEHSFDDPADRGITSITEFSGKLYAGTMNHTTGSHIWRRDGPGGWTDVTPVWDPANTGALPPGKTTVLHTYGDTLYGAGGPPPIIYTSKDGVNWDIDSTLQDADSNNYVIMGVDRLDPRTRHFGPPALFASVGNQVSGAQLWKSPME